MRLLTTFTLFTVCLTTLGQNFQKTKGLTFYPGAFIDTEYRYTDSTGISVIIQNSIRRAGGSLDSTGKVGYTDPTGKHFGYAIFWTRVINETTSPLELSINFPADSFPTSSDSYFKVFLPTDTMTLDKEGLFNYGAKGLKSFLDANLNKPTLLQRTINPKGESLFYVLIISYQTGGIDRTEFILKEQDLLYKVNPAMHDTKLIPCGQVVFKY